MEFSEKDRQQISEHGLTVEKIKEQIQNFTNGFEPLPVESAAGVGNGILVFNADQTREYAALYDNEAQRLSIIKFVPASGAATRMFKDLFSFVNEGKENDVARKTVESVMDFAFYPALPDGMGNGDAKAIVSAVLNYGAALPKGLIYFHSYPDGPRTAFEEHFAEGAMYARSGSVVRLHFTISEEHRTGFEKLAHEAAAKFGDMYGITYEISFSVQDSGTDTIAVTPENEPFRNGDGTLLFLPAGHGALIGNLDHIDADIIFIKNIDNVAPDRLKGETVTYKKLIAGVLLELRNKRDELAAAIAADSIDLGEAAGIIERDFFVRLPKNFEDYGTDDKKAFLSRVLDRPIRVCGMVRNEGEPGGGPFWVSNPDGSTSLQIAEPSQVAPEKAHLLKESTHFNPVDIVCYVRDTAGNKYDLTQFVDPSTGFISEKSKDGKKLKAQELPGLWNGAMADWTTVFVEVPVSTFSPVKEVTDLLRPQHR